MKTWDMAWLQGETGDKKWNADIVGFEADCKIAARAVKELGTNPAGTKVTLARVDCEELGAEGFHIYSKDGGIIIEAREAAGALYGAFCLERLAACGESTDALNITSVPDEPLRMVDHWDNMDGSIERGYSGRSFFFIDNELVVGERTEDYARLCASVGINAVCINNVNVHQEAERLITTHLPEVRKLADLFAEYNIRLYLSLNFAAPMSLGGPQSADPLDPAVTCWWKQTMTHIHEAVPGLGGFLVKADSEGRPGPFTYGRTQADGANMLADIVRDFGWTIIWRCFVYNCQQNWRDYKTDRARAQYDSFVGQDGEYHDNVILQIKNGPIDFQVREPVSPLFGAMPHTRQMLEVQTAQEYTGQQIDLCYLIPEFKEILEHHTYCYDTDDTVADIIAGRANDLAGGIVTVTNTGDDSNWTGDSLAAANWYGFGRLAWDHALTSAQIATEWVLQTLSTESDVVDTVTDMLLRSRDIYESYVAPLGVGFMNEPADHYGPNVDGFEYSRWGTYHRADHLGVGPDRTHAGTGYTAQYKEPLCSMYDSIETCPENLLLFFHHVPYDYRMKDGETLLQHIYDTHFAGVEGVRSLIAQWESLKGRVDETVYANVLERLERQFKNASEWRDQINTYFYRKSGIEDRHGRKIY